MAWLLIPLVLLVVMVIGVRTIRGKWRPPSEDHDRETIARWERAKKKGFCRYSFLQTLPFVVGYCILSPFARSWSRSGALAYPSGEIPFYAAPRCSSLLSSDSSRGRPSILPQARRRSVSGKEKRPVVRRCIRFRKRRFPSPSRRFALDDGKALHGGPRVVPAGPAIPILIVASRRGPPAPTFLKRL
jgi:hypothetical protein